MRKLSCLFTTTAVASDGIMERRIPTYLVSMQEALGLCVWYIRVARLGLKQGTLVRLSLPLSSFLVTNFWLGGVFRAAQAPAAFELPQYGCSYVTFSSQSGTAGKSLN